MSEILNLFLFELNMKSTALFFVILTLSFQVNSWNWAWNNAVVKKESASDIVKVEQDTSKAKCAVGAFEAIGVDCDSMQEDDFMKFCSIITICYLKEILDVDIECDSQMTGRECSKNVVEGGANFIGIYTEFYNKFKFYCFMGKEESLIRKSSSLVAKANSGYQKIIQEMYNLDSRVKESQETLEEFKKIYETSSEEVRARMLEEFEDMKTKNEELSMKVNSIQESMKVLHSDLKNFSKDANESFTQINGDIQRVKEQNSQLKTIASENLELGKETNTELSKVEHGVKNLTKGLEESKKELETFKSETSTIVTEMRNEIKNKQDEFKKEIDNLFNPVKTFMEMIENYVYTWGNALYYFAWFIAIMFFGSFTGSKSIRTILVSTLLMFFVLDKIRMFKFLKEIYTIFATLLLIFGSLFNMTRQFTQPVKQKYQPMYYPQKMPVKVQYGYEYPI